MEVILYVAIGLIPFIFITSLFIAGWTFGAISQGEPLHWWNYLSLCVVGTGILVSAWQIGKEFISD